MALLWLMFLQILAVSDTPLIVTLNGDARPADVVYHADEGEQITIIARSLADEPIDVTLEILQDNQRVAFNDDHHSSRASLGAQDAVIANLVFTAADDYTIRVNSFNGAQRGDVEIFVESIPLAAPCELPLQIGELGRNGRFSCLLSVNSDSSFTITVRDISGTLDPVVMVLDARSARAAYNDDHGTTNLSLNTLDAQISNLVLSRDETYTVQVTDFSGAAGKFELTFAVMP